MADPVRALLLDAVGTLIRLREPPARVYARVAAEHGVRADMADLDERLPGRLARLRPPELAGVPLAKIPLGEREAWRALIRDLLGDAAADGPCFEALLARYARPETWQVVCGASAALDEAHTRGTRIAVVSNMDGRLEGLLGGLGLARWIDALVIPSTCGFAKPDPRIFQIALERLGLPAQTALYVGDRLEDCVEAARAAGLRAVLYGAPASSSDVEGLEDWSQLGRFFNPR